MKREGKTITLLTGTVMTMVLSVACIVGKKWIVEEWNIHKLDAGEEDEVKAAARILGELQSERAVPHLIRHIWKWTEEGKGDLLPHYYEAELNGEKILFKDYDVLQGTWKFNQEVKDALVRIGAHAVPALLDAIKNEDEFQLSVAWALGEMGPVAVSAVPALKGLAGQHASDEGFMSYVDEAIVKIHAR